MFAAPFLSGVLLLVCSAHAASVPAAEAEGEERFLGGLMMLPAYMLHDQWLNLLGVTTTRATPVISAVGGFVDGLLGVTTTTTTEAPCSGGGGLLGFGLLGPPCTTAMRGTAGTGTAGRALHHARHHHHHHHYNININHNNNRVNNTMRGAHRRQSPLLRIISRLGLDSAFLLSTTVMLSKLSSLNTL